LVFYKREKEVSKNQEEIVEKIKDLTTEQSRLIKIMEERRQKRIRSLKRRLLDPLDSVKKEYEKLKAVDDYASTSNKETLDQIKNIAERELIRFRRIYDYIVDHVIPDAREYIENPWIISELPLYLPLMSQGFQTATETPSEINTVRIHVKLSVDKINEAIDEINKEKEE
jgi:hypothetical protein